MVSISPLLVADGDAHAHTATIFLTVREMKRHVPKAYAVLVSRMGPLDVENDNGTAAAARLRHTHIASAACTLPTLKPEVSVAIIIVSQSIVISRSNAISCTALALDTLLYSPPSI